MLLQYDWRRQKVQNELVRFLHQYMYVWDKFETPSFANAYVP